MDIEADIDAAALHFSSALKLIDDGALEASGFDGYTRRMAFLHAMQSGHTSAETALRRVLLSLGEALPEGADWHAVLIRRCSQAIDGERTAILSQRLADALQETRGFRHVATHVYGDIRPASARLAADSARVVNALLRAELSDFWKRLEQP
jgi:hypothetical protein